MAELSGIALINRNLADWSDDRIGALRRLWRDGLSATQIAEMLGGVTRNAVIGKAHRLGLSSRPSPIRRPASPGTAVSIPGRCQWPHGDPKQPGFHYCHAEAVPGRPYCAEHCARAYRKPGDDYDA